MILQLGKLWYLRELVFTGNLRAGKDAWRKNLQQHHEKVLLGTFHKYAQFSPLLFSMGPIALQLWIPARMFLYALIQWFVLPSQGPAEVVNSFSSDGATQNPFGHVQCEALVASLR